MARARLPLAHLPTPLISLPRTGERLGLELWVKRDDASGGAEAGNKIRKLEYLLADAIEQGADTVITCGGIQSNHARATALLGAQLGLETVLMLRAPGLEHDDEGAGVPPTGSLTGNLLLDRLVGADVRLITAASYRERAMVMDRAAVELRARGKRPYVIPEGGSNGLGSLGYVAAMAELRAQLGDTPGFDVVVVACGSAGTAAGVALGAGNYDVARAVRAIAVCNDQPYFEERIRAILLEARALEPALGEPAPWSVEARFKGPAYGVSTAPQRRSMVRVARESGLVLDPVYSGKAFFALEELAPELSGQRVLFVHTGGLPGLLAEPDVLERELD